jgi:hypothetical protein
MVNFFVSHRYGPQNAANVHTELSEPDETLGMLNLNHVSILICLHHLIALLTCGPIPIRCRHFEAYNCDHRGIRPPLMPPTPLAAHYINL